MSTGESPQEIALDVVVRLEQDPVATLLVAAELVAAASRMPLGKRSNTRRAIENAHAALTYAVRAIRGG